MSTDTQQACLAKVEENHRQISKILENTCDNDEDFDALDANYRALRAVLLIPNRGDTGFFNPELNVRGAIRNNAIDLVRDVIAKELGLSDE